MITTAAAWARMNAAPMAVSENQPADRTTALSTVHARLNRITTHAAVLLTRGREEITHRTTAHATRKTPTGASRTSGAPNRSSRTGGSSRTGAPASDATPSAPQAAASSFKTK